jgi:ribonuclease HII
MGYRAVAGVDEAGCGALAGPVVAGAVIIDPDICIAHLTDSKLLSPADRCALLVELRSLSRAWAMGLVPPRDIDRLNIYQARMLAMTHAVAALSVAADFAVIDGPAAPPLNIPCKPVVDGDRKCRAVSAGSIVAKVVRDAIMEQLDALYPEYGFAAHKGYATRQHLDAIGRYGPSPVHRMSFAPMNRRLQCSMDFTDA